MRCIKLLCLTRLRTVYYSPAREGNRVAITGTMVVSHIWKHLRLACLVVLPYVRQQRTIGAVENII